MGDGKGALSSSIAALAKHFRERKITRIELETMRFAPLLTIVVFTLGGCSSIPGADGRYATPARGGWDNFRAEMPDSTFRAEVVGDTRTLLSDSSIAGRENNMARGPQPMRHGPRSNETP